MPCCIMPSAWRGLLILGVLPALVVVYIRKYVEEPEIWARNRETQRKQKREVHSVGQVPG
jgi:SHS family lactate transporter-like MFS transporter